MPLRLLLRSLFCAGILGVVACGQVNSAKTGVAGPNPIGTGGGSTTPAPPSGGGGGTVVNSAGFFVAATASSNKSAVQFMHQADAAFTADIGTTNFSSECKIADGSADGGDMVCVAEVEELDLWFNDLYLQYHVPSDMCYYMMVRPYWFYAYAPGKGPSTAAHHIASDGTITDISNTSGGVPVCTYDYTTVGGPNCCFGSFNHTVTTYASDGVTVVSQVTTGKTWGGSVGNCVAGAGATPGNSTTGITAFGRNSLGVPMTAIFNVNGTGLNNIYHVTGPANSLFNGKGPLNSSVWSANFYKPSQHTGNRPIPMQTPAGIPGAAGAYIPSPAYSFTCLDAAFEFKQRILLTIREWNNHAEMHEGGDPDVTGFEPGYGGTLPLNDFADWKDFGDNYPASNL